MAFDYASKIQSLLDAADAFQRTADRETDPEAARGYAESAAHHRAKAEEWNGRMTNRTDAPAITTSKSIRRPFHQRFEATITGNVARSDGGTDTVTVSVQHHDQETAVLLVRRAYNALNQN